MLDSCPNVKDLYISKEGRYSDDGSYMNDFFHSLTQHKSLQSLSLGSFQNFCNKDISLQMIRCFFSIMSENNSIRHLSFRDFKIEYYFDDVSVMLKKNSTLQSLSLQECNPKDIDKWQNFAEVIKNSNLSGFMMYESSNTTILVKEVCDLLLKSIAANDKMNDIWLRPLHVTNVNIDLFCHIVSRMKSVSCGMSFEDVNLSNIFFERVAASTTLREFRSTFFFSPHLDLQMDVILKNVERNGYILNLSLDFEKHPNWSEQCKINQKPRMCCKKINKRNKDNYVRAVQACEVIFALQKVRMSNLLNIVAKDCPMIAKILFETRADYLFWPESEK